MSSSYKKEFILGENNRCKLKRFQSTDIVNQIEELKSDLKLFEGQTTDQEVETPKDTSTPHKSSRIIQPSIKYELTIVNLHY